MALRTGHGAGRGVPRVEVLPADELPRGNADQTAVNLASRRARGRPFAPGNAAARGRRPKLAMIGAPVDTADPLWRPLAHQAARYRRRRISELEAVHGYVSAGVSSLLASSALALAASRFAYAKAAESGDPAALKVASTLANDSRQAELAAIELCAREAAARPKTVSATDGALARLGIVKGGAK